MRTQQSQATRERIVQASSRLLAGRGSLDVSMSEVAVAAGVSEPTVYRHFANKDELFGAVAAVDLQLESTQGSAVAGNLDDLLATLPHVYRRALEQEALLRWTLTQQRRLTSRPGGTRRLAMLYHSVRGAHPDAVEHLVRLIALLSSPLAALYWKDELGLSPKTGADTAAWAIRAIASLATPSDRVSNHSC